MAGTPTAADAQGALSTGDYSNPLFARVEAGTGRKIAGIGDVAWCDLTPPADEEALDFTLPGIAGLRLALDDAGAPGTFGAIGAGLPMGDWSGTRRAWLLVAEAADPAPKLIIPPGFTAVVGVPGVSGDAGSTSGASGDVSEVADVSGKAGATSGARGNVATSGPQVEAVSGGAGSQSGAKGDVAEVAEVSGKAGSVSGAKGDVVGAAAASLAAGTYYLLGTLLTGATAPTATVFEPSDHWFGEAGAVTMAFRLGGGSWSNEVATASPAEFVTVVAQKLDMVAAGGEQTVSVRITEDGLSNVATWALPSALESGQLVDFYFETRGEYDAETGNWHNAWLGANTRIVVA